MRWCNVLYVQIYACRYLSSIDCFATKNVSAKGNFGLKTNLVVSSIDFCQCKFDKGDIGFRLSSGDRHSSEWVVSTILLECRSP
jgi:hypothetical protein